MNFIRKHKILSSIAGVVIVFIVALIAVGAATAKPVTTNKVSAGSAQPAASQPAYTPSAAPTPAPTTAAPAPTTPAPTTPALTTGQQQAIDSAQSYLSDGQGFSDEGLLQQLTSSYGEGFSQADAQFAITYLHPDWYQQAVESAKGYIANVGGFSASSLYQQLTSSYGEGFTSGQANYALTQVGY